MTLFRSNRLERLTVVSLRGFVVLWAILLPAITFVAISYAPTMWAPALIGLGWLVWSLTEYLLHRHVFHFEPRSRLLQRAVFIIHGNHHSDSNDPLRNLMPPIVSIPVGLLIWAAAIAIAGPAGSWILLGFMSGYVLYDLVHYACHQFPMKGGLGRRLKTHHMRHHHLRAKGNYAITGMLWDRVFSTYLSSNSKV
ncbi:sterol desaturase family protein [Porphyrobacter sp. AAP60]|uniref:sterol desaturase family protein n=1 Tax=Porphyrobacter sp. AAP60 TaxID=1523423 RepID=UPI001F36910C|nr:sterol desaturase family protein [Porphyrobacter sp. AAP60]